jgi:outer membrane lipoprotein-sorting protein
MAPELAFQVFENRTARQNAALSSYSATTVIRAELPETAQQGEFELKRMFTAPKTLLFKALQFTGDTFVKTNVITRLLQSEVEHVEKQNPASTALSDANYKFSYKGTKEVDGKLTHVFQLKPHKKRVGLVKGRLWLDAHTGSLVRIEGAPAKSPSLFLRKIQFVQDYADFGPFTFPVHIHSEAKASIVGRTIVDIYHRDYQAVSNAQSAGLLTDTPAIRSSE